MILPPTIKHECSIFLEESNNKPLIKNLSIYNDGFKKIKVRKKKQQDIFTKAFNIAFPEHKDIFQRSIFANGDNAVMPIINNVEPFYIFPIDGYKFMYNIQVKNSSIEYKESIDNILKNINVSAAIEIFSDIIRKSYNNIDLEHGINSDAEIIIYGIPYYYAIRKSLVDHYVKLG